MKNKCSHYYTEYNRCHLPARVVELKCSRYRGCGQLLKRGLIFHPEDYEGNGLVISKDRIVWDDGTVEDIIKI